MNFRKTYKIVSKKILLSLALFSLLVDHNVKVKRKKKFYRKKILFCYSSIKNGEESLSKKRKRKFYCSTRSFVVYWCHNFINLGIISMEKLSRLLNGSVKAMDSCPSFSTTALKLSRLEDCFTLMTRLRHSVHSSLSSAATLECRRSEKKFIFLFLSSFSFVFLEYLQSFFLLHVINREQIRTTTTIVNKS